LSIFGIQEKLTQDDNERKGSWSSYATQEKQIDDELYNLLSSSGTQVNKPQDDDELGGLSLPFLT
jgi:hypothetical protein